MRGSGWIVGLVCLLVVAFAPNSPACMLRVFTGREDPQEIAAKEGQKEMERVSSIGEREFLTVHFIQSHRNCPIPADATRIRTKGLRIVEESTWEAVRSGIYEKTLTVEYIRKGLASFVVERTCSRGGMKREVMTEVK